MTSVKYYPYEVVKLKWRFCSDDEEMSVIHICDFKILDKKAITSASEMAL